MKNIYITVIVILSAITSIKAQNITMELIDPQPFLQGSDTGDMEFGDLDGDGDMDLIITGSGNMSDGTVHTARTTLYLNDGTGNFVAVTDNTIENIRLSKIGLGDIDDDTDLDLLISGFTHGGTPLTKLYTNNGTGEFTEIADSSFQDIDNGYFNFGDLDNDGDLDIIFSGGHNGINDVVKYSNDGTGNFSLDSTIGVTNVSGVLDLSDLDGDNDLDLLVSGEDTSGNISTRLYLNNGTGNFSMVPDAGFNNISFGDIATGDTDLDGDLDVVITGGNEEGQIVTELYINEGDNSFNQLTEAPFLGLGFDGETSLNDFDNDGDLDLFAIGSANGGLPNIFSHIYENLGNNIFILSSEFTGGYLSTHAAADVDGDNLLDVVIGGTTTASPVRVSFMYKNVSEVLGVNSPYLDQNVSLYPNPSNGTFTLKFRQAYQSDLQIYNFIGQLVSRRILYPKKANTIQLDLPNGVYLALIDTGEKRITKKIIIQN